MRYALFVVGVLGFSGCATLLDPAGARYEEASALEASGKLDEALSRYREIETGWPDSPQAKMVPEATARVYARKAGELFAAGDFDGVASAAADIEKAGGTLAPEIKLAVDFAAKRRAAPDDASLPWLDEVRRGAPSPLTEAVTAWGCDHRKEFPAWSTCAAVPADLSRVSDLTALTTALEACKRLEPLRAACSSASEDFAALASLSAIDARLVEVAQAESLALSQSVDTAGQAWCAASAQTEKLDREMAILAVENRLGAALRMEPQAQAARERSTAKQEVFEGLKERISGGPWSDATRAELTSKYDGWKKKCDG